MKIVLLIMVMLLTNLCRLLLPDPASRALRETALRYHTPASETSPTVLRASVVGHAGLAADWRYVQSVLMMGARGHYRSVMVAMPWAHRMLSEALMLDARFEAPLRLGAVVLALYGQESAAAARDFARTAGPQYRGEGAAWKPLLWEGQAAYFAGDFIASRTALTRALAAGGPPWIEGLLTHAAAQGAGNAGLRATAEFLRAIAAEEEKQDWKASTLQKADALDNLADLRDAVQHYRARHGRAPTRLAELGIVLPDPLSGAQWALDADGNPIISGLIVSDPQRSIPPPFQGEPQ